MALLDVRDIRVHYGRTVALDGVSLSVGRGEVVGILGPNGAGKTTLLDAIGGTCAVGAGSVVLDGVDVTALPAERRARLGLARTFQSVELVPSLTVEENLLLGCHAHRRSGFLADALGLPSSRHAEEAARDDVASIVDALSLRRERHAAVTSLPLGTRRMVEIGRALAVRPSLLLLDEVGSGMEPDMLQRVAGLLGRLTAHGTGVLLIEHDADFVLANCDFVYVLAGGRVLLRGTPAALRREPALHDIYLGRSVDAAVA